MIKRSLACGLLFLLSSSVVASDEMRAEFIRETGERHGVDPAAVESVLSGARYQQSIINAISRPAEAKPWSEYRPIFLTSERIRDGRRFKADHAEALRAVEADTGVPPEMVVSILGVETFYGRITGSFRVLDALYTLGFHYPPRQDFFRRELGHLFALVEEEGLDIEAIRGSYAGAMGWGQFIPSSYRAYAKDGDGDGRRDLFGSLPDVFASVANYFVVHGWQPGQLVAVPAQADEGAEPFRPGNSEANFSLAELGEKGFRPARSVGHDARATLLTLEGAQGTEYWITFQNFYVITRYNRSPLYAMAVKQLAEAIAAGEGAQPAP